MNIHKHFPLKGSRMHFDRMTINSQKLLQLSHEFALSLNQEQLEPEHLLLTMISDEESSVRCIINKIGSNINHLCSELFSIIKKFPQVSECMDVYVSERLESTFRNAFIHAANMKDEYLNVDHIFLAIIDETFSEASKILLQNKIDKSSALTVLAELRGGETISDPNTYNRYQSLKKYSINLTDLAKLGKLDPVIGRDEEIRRVIQVLSRRTKNNPVLIGEPGVGKTAIIEGLAQRIVKEDVCSSLKNKMVISLDMGTLIAGAKLRGEFEDRLKSVLREVEKSEGAIILFIDEIHTIVKNGTSDGTIDVSSLFKPQLARGSLRCIGATTINEYRNHIEKDTALERRFQPILVCEPSVEDTISILRGLKEKYESHHCVRIKDSAIIASAVLSKRYIPERFLPDKAIDLIDECASKLRIEIDSIPAEIDDVRRKITKLEIEQLSLKKEKDPFSRTRLKKIGKDLSILTHMVQCKENHWKNEKKLIQRIRNIHEDLEKVITGEKESSKNDDSESVSKLRYQEIDDLKNMLEISELELQTLQTEKKMLKEEVDNEDIATVIASWTGIPISRILEAEREKLIKMEEILSQRVIGQQPAITAVSNAIRRARSGLQDPHRPIGSFLFMGPTGVGKTELAKALAEFIFNSEQSIVRLDMSEYMEKHSIAKMIGAPPGYVGYESGGYLTEIIRRRPYAVILFDEIEKAHPEVFNILLQLLDAGRMTDSHGRTVDFTNTIIIMTSNIGSRWILELDENQRKEVENRIYADLNNHFKPEFLNRIDECIVFYSLTPAHIGRIVSLQTNLLKSRLNEKGITLSISENARIFLVGEGYDSSYGARPLKRALQKYIENPLAMQLLKGTITDGDKLMADAKDSRIVFYRSHTPSAENDT